MMMKNVAGVHSLDRGDLEADLDLERLRKGFGIRLVQKEG
jgi:hypothetical protein